MQITRHLLGTIAEICICTYGALASIAETRLSNSENVYQNAFLGRPLNYLEAQFVGT